MIRAANPAHQWEDDQTIELPDDALDAWLDVALTALERRQSEPTGQDTAA